MEKATDFIGTVIIRLKDGLPPPSPRAIIWYTAPGSSWRRARGIATFSGRPLKGLQIPSP